MTPVCTDTPNSAKKPIPDDTLKCVDLVAAGRAFAQVALVRRGLLGPQRAQHPYCRVVAIVETNYGPGALRSHQFYTHFSLLKSIEGGLGLPCLNHACDSEVKVMSDLFAAQ